MEINIKKIRSVPITEEALKIVEIEEIEKNLNCKVIYKTPVTLLGVYIFLFYSDDFIEGDNKYKWIIRYNYKDNGKFEWCKE